MNECIVLHALSRTHYYRLLCCSATFPAHPVTQSYSVSLQWMMPCKLLLGLAALQLCCRSSSVSRVVKLKYLLTPSALSVLNFFLPRHPQQHSCCQFVFLSHSLRLQGPPKSLSLLCSQQQLPNGLCEHLKWRAVIPGKWIDFQ